MDFYDELNADTSGGDVYFRNWESDGLESSRDLIAFYAQDGGAITNGGDGNFYFRVDVLDLVAFAEDSGLDFYVVIDIGNTDIGEVKLVDNLDITTSMQWELVVAAYDRNVGTVYVNIPGSPDTSSINDEIIYSETNVQIRTQVHPDGFKQSFYDSIEDSIEISISRSALIDAGWTGDFNQLNFQVFSTRDGTNDGEGELDGPDIHDSIRNNFISEDFAGLVGDNVEVDRYQNRLKLKKLDEWIGVGADNNRGQQIKIIPIFHGNEHIQPSEKIKELIHSSNDDGIYRALDIHESFEIPFSMHITPTLASSLEWAKLRNADGNLNSRLIRLLNEDKLALAGSTFSDHMMPYFNSAFNIDNMSLADTFLTTIYGNGNISTNVFWTPERLLNQDVLSDLLEHGYRYTFIDQTQHLYKWFNIDETRGDNAYRINLINGMRCIPITDRIKDLWLKEHDGGISLDLRKFLLDRALSGVWDGQHPQIVTLKLDWQEFNNDTAEIYEKTIRWLAGKKWTKIITIDDLANEQLDISVPPDGVSDTWKMVDRGTNTLLSTVGHTWLQHATQENFDHWYYGSAYNEGLVNKTFYVNS